MLEDTIFEVAGIQHAEALQDIAYVTFSETFAHLYTPENLQHHLDTYFSAHFFEREMAKGSTIYIARTDERIIGYVKFGQVDIPIAHDDADIEIHRLYVRSLYQGKGVSQKLMSMVLQNDHVQLAPRVFLGVWENNIKAQRFYSKYHFSPVGEYLYYVGTHADREIIMQRIIHNSDDNA